jgi:multiple sugar transport system substrate-binding protein
MNLEQRIKQANGISTTPEHVIQLVPSKTMNKTILTLVRQVCASLGLAAFGFVICHTPTARGQTQVKFWIHSSVDVREENVYRHLAETFSQKNPQIQVKAEKVPGSETDVTKLMTAVRSGAGPDVYLLDRFTVAQRAASGLLRDLTPYLKKEGKDLSQDYLDFAWKDIVYQNKIYGIPIGTDARALFYNKALLKEGGIDPAELDPANGPISPERFKEIAFKLNKQDASGAYTVIGFVPWLEQGWGYSWGFAFGGSFFDFANCKITSTNPGVVAGYQFLYDWAKDLGPQKARTFVDTYWQWPTIGTLPEEQMPFITGKVAMVLTGQWLLPLLKTAAPNMDYGVTYIPAPNGTKTSWSGGWSLVIPQGAKNSEAAYQFIRFVTGEEGQTELARIAGTLPTLQSLTKRSDLFPPEYSFFLNLLPVAQSRPPIPVGALYWDKLKDAEEAVITNSQTPQEALQSVIDEVQPQMNRYCK